MKLHFKAKYHILMDVILIMVSNYGFSKYTDMT